MLSRVAECGIVTCDVVWLETNAHLCAMLASTWCGLFLREFGAQGLMQCRRAETTVVHTVVVQHVMPGHKSESQTSYQNSSGLENRSV
jgi:hypothetical protein